MPVVPIIMRWSQTLLNHHYTVVHGRMSYAYPGGDRYLYVAYEADRVANFPEFRRLWRALPRGTRLYKPDLDDEEDD